MLQAAVVDEATRISIIWMWFERGIISEKSNQSEWKNIIWHISIIIKLAEQNCVTNQPSNFQIGRNFFFQLL